MTFKVVPIQDKMSKPTLSEVVTRQENLFNNYVLRGEDKLTVVLTTLSYCIWNLQKTTGNDEEVLNLIQEILNQYIKVDRDESTFSSYALFESLVSKIGPDDE